MTILLGGPASPIGWVVQFLDAPVDRVLADLVEHHAQNHPSRLSDSRPYPDVLHDLTPFESPWTRELLMPCGEWTAYLNNDVGGGDPTAAGHALAMKLGVRCVIADNSPRYGPGHESTQLWVVAPGQSLTHERTISAVATDGHWEWRVSGEPYNFEDLDRYAAPRIRDRFDRGLLLRYLNALGIPADDDSSYGVGVIVQGLTAWKPSRTVSLEEHRRELLPSD